MAGTKTAAKNSITLKGSTEIVAEFFVNYACSVVVVAVGLALIVVGLGTCTRHNVMFGRYKSKDGEEYGINSILYQRGIYPPETFTRKQKYGLTLLVTTEDSLKKYISEILKDVTDWLQQMTVQKLVIVIKSLDMEEVLERWQFDIECDKTMTETSAPRDKSDKEIKNEIRDMIRQITATVTFLPLLDAGCVFEILVYTDKDMETPEPWGESGPQFIANSEQVQLRSFTTTIHKVGAAVAYKKDD